LLGRLVAPKSGAASQKNRARSKRHPDRKRHPDQTKNSDKLALNQRHRCDHRFRKARLSAIQSGFLRQVPGRFKSILAEPDASFKEFFRLDGGPDVGIMNESHETGIFRMPDYSAEVAEWQTRQVQDLVTV